LQTFCAWEGILAGLTAKIGYATLDFVNVNESGFLMRANHNRVTLKEVAAAAGVSAQTVSRVVNGRSDVAPQTREHVQHVIDRLGYKPSKIARSLIQGRSYSLGVVSMGVGFYGPAQTLAGIQQEADEQGYSLLLKMLSDPEELNVDDMIQDILSYHVDGIVWAIPEIGQNRDWIQRALPKLSVPIAFLTMQARPNLTTIAIDNRLGGRLATRNLIEHGCQKIGLITGPLNWWEARQRELGWREELLAHNDVVDESCIAHGDWNSPSGEHCMRMLLDWHSDLDGVFASNDQMALGAMKAARELNRRIPEDLSIVGFDDIPESAYFYPPLTTIRQDMSQVGGTAVNQLIHLLEHTDENGRPNAFLLEPELIVRDSTK